MVVQVVNSVVYFGFLFYIFIGLVFDLRLMLFGCIGVGLGYLGLFDGSVYCRFVLIVNLVISRFAVLAWLPLCLLCLMIMILDLYC